MNRPRQSIAAFSPLNFLLTHSAHQAAVSEDRGQLVHLGSIHLLGPDTQRTISNHMPLQVCGKDM
ncbi:hypothetical protein RvY_04010 [Ramazzottius varieornatus]|uniref:Uncharacterized protein n=1 Tax=Ramazzottius varieornatus TaxID=947166 RepID=A0A1D1UQ26_RAMVA|nr:hypothetical protein RvY_04010 [Ramazzottius varieornatus]